MGSLAGKDAVRRLPRFSSLTLVTLLLLKASSATAQDASQPTPAPPSSTDELVRALSSPVAAERVNAIRGLGESRDATAVEPLTTLLRSDPVPEVRGWTVRALHQIGTPEAVRAVVAAARDDPDERVRTMATQLAGPSQQPTASEAAAPPGFQTQTGWQAAPQQVQVRPTRPRIPGRGLRVGGVVTLSTTYGLALLVGLALLTAGDDPDPYTGESLTNRVEWGWKLLLPIVGPAVASTTSTYREPDLRGFANVMCWFWSAAQVAGITLLAAGYALRAKHNREQADDAVEEEVEEEVEGGYEEDLEGTSRPVGIAFVPAGPAGFALVGYF